jgi:predicted small secreted protein
LVGFEWRFREILMRHGKRYGAAGLLLAALMLTSVGSLLSACNTVAGAGQDVSTIGNTVTSGAEQTRRATGIP